MLKNRKIRILFVLILTVVLLLPEFTSAQDSADKNIGARNSLVILPILDFGITVTATSIVLLQNVFNKILGMGLVDSNGKTWDIVINSWGMVRNFVNMMFVIALIVMAFAAIFNVSGYNVQSMIVRFIIAALLINFSLVIGTTIIDWSQSLSNIFLKAIGNFGLRLGEGLKPSETLLNPTVKGVLNLLGGGGGLRFGSIAEKIYQYTSSNMTWGQVHIMFFNMILGLILAFSLLVGVAMTIIRIPALMMLLIFSPVAWVLYVLPATKKYNKMWWNYFLGWNFFLPIYLFFLYLGVYFLNNSPAALAGLSSENDFIVQFQYLFNYAMVAIVMVGGAKFAMTGGMAAGAGGVAAGVWARGVAVRRAAWRGTGVPGAVEAKRKQLAEEGYRIPFTQKHVFGEQQRREREARFGSILGVRGMGLGIQREFISKTEKEYKDLQDQFDTRKITDTDIEAGAKSGSATNPRIYAYRKMLAKLGRLDSAIYTQTLKELSDNPLAARDFAQAAKETKYSNLKGKELIEMTTGIDESGAAVAAYADLDTGSLVPAKKEQARFIQSDELIRSKLTERQVNRLVDILGGATTADGKNFLKDIGENRPDLNIEYSVRNNALRADLITKYGIATAGRAPTDIDREIKERSYDSVMTTDAKKLALMPIESDPTKPRRVWDRPEFQQALENYIGSFRSNTSKRRFLTNMSTQLHNIKDPQERANKEVVFHNILGHLGVSTP